jgi:hypothetical protein
MPNIVSKLSFVSFFPFFFCEDTMRNILQ